MQQRKKAVTSRINKTYQSNPNAFSDKTTKAPQGSPLTPMVLLLNINERYRAYT
jgi:hypothetical protein